MSSFTQQLLNFHAGKFLKQWGFFLLHYVQEETDLSKFLLLTPKQSSWLNGTTGFDLWVNCILGLILKSWSRKRPQCDKSVQKNKPLIMCNVVESSLESPLEKGQRRAER